MRAVLEENVSFQDLVFDDFESSFVFDLLFREMCLIFMYLRTTDFRYYQEKPVFDGSGIPKKHGDQGSRWAASSRLLHHQAYNSNGGIGIFHYLEISHKKRMRPRPMLSCIYTNKFRRSC